MFPPMSFENSCLIFIFFQFISFLPISLANTFSPVLNSSGDSGHPCLAFDHASLVFIK